MNDTALRRLTDSVRTACAHGEPLRIRGGGTKDFLGQGLEGEVLDTRALAGIVSYEPTELVITARAGTPLAVLEAALAEKGQYLPFEPPRFGADSTVGGMVAAGLSGPARASVGAVRDYVLGVQLLNGRGELLNFGGQVMKNVAGYDLSRLMAGAWGTLGLLVEVSLKVLPIPPAEATLRFDMGQAEALTRLNAWAGQPLPLNASCWVEDNQAGALYLRLRGATAAVEAACRRLGGERVDNDQARADWEACRDQRLPWFRDRAPTHALWRLSVPQTTPALVLPDRAGSPLVEWFGGQRWVQAPVAAASALREIARRHDGYATLFVAPTQENTLEIPRFEPTKSPLNRIHARLKAEFDPAGILNRGRLLPGL